MAILHFHPHLQTSSLSPVPSVSENDLDSCLFEAITQELLNILPFYYFLSLIYTFSQPVSPSGYFPTFSP